jgi:dTDP-3-amino-3,4,6-trideoxy-alpha-D-glucose transaminase
VTQHIPFLDLKRLHQSIRPGLEEAIDRVVAASAFVGGEEVEAFESDFATAHGCPSAAGCASGTDALALTLRALGVGPGDEVIVPSMTFVATAEAVVHVGATPVLADVDRDTLLLSAEDVEKVRTSRTVAVIPVHLYGHIVPFEAIDAWKATGLLVVEDAAQAHLGESNGEYVGSRSDAACFSFYPGKNLGALGDGGMVISRDASVIDEVRRLRNHGRVSKYTHDVSGWCSRLDGLQAAVLRTKLPHLRSWTEARRTLASQYRERLGTLLVRWDTGAVHHLLVARTSEPEQVADILRSQGIATGRHYPLALSQQPWLARLGSTPNAEDAAARVLSLPMDPLMGSDEVEAVSNALLEALPLGDRQAHTG